MAYMKTYMTFVQLTASQFDSENIEQYTHIVPHVQSLNGYSALHRTIVQTYDWIKTFSNDKLIY